jgi:acyl-CoA thioester hydrolase
MEGFKHKTPIQVRFKDVDMMGHINNADYFSYVEVARLKYYDTVIGADSDWHDQHGLIMAHFEINFLKAASFDDMISVYTRCSKLGKKSFELEWKIVSESNEQETTLADGKTVIVCYDYNSALTVEIPPDRKQMIKEFDGL